MDITALQLEVADQDGTPDGLQHESVVLGVDVEMMAANGPRLWLVDVAIVRYQESGIVRAMLQPRSRSAELQQAIAANDWAGGWTFFVRETDPLEPHVAANAFAVCSTQSEPRVEFQHAGSSQWNFHGFDCVRFRFRLVVDSKRWNDRYAGLRLTGGVVDLSLIHISEPTRPY